MKITKTETDWAGGNETSTKVEWHKDEFYPSIHKEHSMNKKWQWFWFILGLLITAVLTRPIYGTAEYAIGMLSRWWI